VVSSAQCDAIFPNQFPGILRVITRDGRELVKEVLFNRGGPGRPLSFDELGSKFYSNASRMLSDRQIASVRDTVQYFEQLNDVGQVLRAGQAA
jgi:hypothetical protein